MDRRGLLYECWACVCVRVSVCDLHVSLCDFYAGVCDLPAMLLPQGLESTSGLSRKRQGGWLSANSLGEGVPSTGEGLRSLGPGPGSVPLHSRTGQTQTWAPWGFLESEPRQEA